MRRHTVGPPIRKRCAYHKDTKSTKSRRSRIEDGGWRIATRLRSSILDPPSSIFLSFVLFVCFVVNLCLKFRSLILGPHPTPRRIAALSAVFHVSHLELIERVRQQRIAFGFD